MEPHRSSPRSSHAAGPQGGWLLEPLHALILASLARLFARLERMLMLWKSGQLPPLQSRRTPRRARMAEPRRRGLRAPRRRAARRRPPASP